MACALHIARLVEHDRNVVAVRPDRGSPPGSPLQAQTAEPADWPWSLGWLAWKGALRNVGNELTKDDVVLVAAGVAFFGFLSLFPALAAIVALYGLLFDPVNVQTQMEQLEGLLPTSARSVLASRLEQLAAAAPDSLSLGVIVALMVATWSATKGTRGIVLAINLAYGETETRGLVRRYLLSFALTAGSILVFLITITLAAVVPVVLDHLGLDRFANAAVSFGRWPVLVLVMLFSIAVLYATAPNRKCPRWWWVLPGSVLSTIALLVASGLFSLYVSNFGSYNEIYGSIGAVAVFMLWLYLGAFVVLAGAELNAELEQRVRGRSAPRHEPVVPDSPEE